MLVPQKVWNTISRPARLEARARGIECSGGQRRCRNCYQNGWRAGRLHSRKNERRRPLTSQQLIRLRELVGLPREDIERRNA